MQTTGHTRKKHQSIESIGNTIEFSFNDDMIKSDALRQSNFAICISDKKDFAGFNRINGNSLTGFVQDSYGCRFFSDDFMTLLAFLQKLRKDYDRIPYLKPGEVKPNITDSTRIRKFSINRNEKTEAAKIALDDAAHEELFAMTPFDPLKFLTSHDDE